MFSVLMNEPPGGGSWEEDAACKEHDHSLWILSENPDDRELNTQRFEKAEVICSTCPVFQQCWQYATYTDKRVTMRAGAWPLEYREPDAPKEPKTECGNGHDLTVSNAKGPRGDCRECTRERVRKYRARVAAEKAAR